MIPYMVLDPQGRPVEPIRRFLRDFLARGHAAGSVRSYAFDLHRWWRFLHVIDVPWDKVTSGEVRDFVLWMGQAEKQRRSPRTTSAATAGQVNAVTRKQNLGDQYSARTIRHSNAVLRCFYEFVIDAGEGPLVNPVRRDRVRGRRANAHHNPLEPFRAEGRLRYNPKVPRQRPRAMPDERWNELFAAMGSNRDRAILALAVSTAARASELLGLRGADLDWGDQLAQVRRKGSGVQQWLPASAESFVWLRLYLEENGTLGPDDPIWWTLRRRKQSGELLERRPLTYDALRAVLRRANAALGTNWTMHDFRHTAALRMVRSQRLSLRDVQVILGHAHLTTTQIYLVEDDHEVLRRVQQFLAERSQPEAEPAQDQAAVGYDADDLAVLLGGVPR
ncbi:tyrosine-type recombinase/integrase [Streptomyces benahoarensis]|uniref:tyrosine-type recombinase/integrase n=1 Tax=Streptomyces benahoarensis TaxID=2595054 RepID=UPI00203611F7|nr:site-specific integrase [Streptomyces benahoarensis]